MHQRLIEQCGKPCSVRGLGGNRAGEMRFKRFLDNPAVTVAEMVATAQAGTQERVAGQHVLAIEDTTSVRAAGEGGAVQLHAVIAVGAGSGTLYGLCGAEYLIHQEAGKTKKRQSKPYAEKDSLRWLTGIATAAQVLLQAKAASVTVVADREADIYEVFALKPEGVELVIRAAQNRKLKGGGSLFATAASFAEAGGQLLSLPASRGRPARRPKLKVRFGEVELACPKNRLARHRTGLPNSLRVSLVEIEEVDPPDAKAKAHWRLLTSRRVATLEQAIEVASIYAKRWTIEELFRTLKSGGFCIEMLRQRPGPLENLVTACLIAAVSVLQMVRERDGKGGRPFTDAFDPQDKPLLAAVSASLEGKTAKQKNPHPPDALAFATWICARLGGWNCYYGKPGPLTLLRGLLRLHAMKQGWRLRDV